MCIFEIIFEQHRAVDTVVCKKCNNRITSSIPAYCCAKGLVFNRIRQYTGSFSYSHIFLVVFILFVYKEHLNLSVKRAY